MAASSFADKRLLALMLMRRQAGSRKLSSYLTIGRGMIDDGDNDCRWQALILLGEDIRNSPEQIWDIVKNYGTSKDADMRAGVACVLREHLIEHHPTYRQLSKRIAGKSKLFADTLATCWDFNEVLRQ